MNIGFPVVVHQLNAVVFFVMFKDMAKWLEYSKEWCLNLQSDVAL